MSAVLSDTRHPADVRADALIEEVARLKDTHAASFRIGYLNGLIRKLCYELIPTETQHEKVLRLLKEAREIVASWTTHPVAADEATDADEAITVAIEAVWDVFFEQEKAAEES